MQQWRNVQNSVALPHSQRLWNAVSAVAETLNMASKCLLHRSAVSVDVLFL